MALLEAELARAEGGSFTALAEEAVRLALATDDAEIVIAAHLVAADACDADDDEGGAALIPPTSMHQCGRPLEHPESLAPDGGLARPLPEVIGPAGGIGDGTRWPSYSLW